MPHVDEGTLHALLDGALSAEEPTRAEAVEAHLRSCPDCRARLERADDVRGQAAGILAALEPEAAAPDFEEVLVRSGQGSAPGTGAADGDRAARPTTDPARQALARRARRTRGLAWAATLVIALGTGYLLGQEFGFMDAPEQGLTDNALPQAAPASDAPAGAASPEAAAPPPGPITGRSAEPTVQAPSEDLAVEAAPAGDAVDETAEEERTAEVLAEEAIRPTAAASSSGAAVAADLVAGAAFGAVEAEWRPVTADEAGRLLGGPLLRLPDAEMDQLTARTFTGGVDIRSTQTLPGGVVVVATQRRGPLPLGSAARKPAEQVSMQRARPDSGRLPTVEAARARSARRVEPAAPPAPAPEPQAEPAGARTAVVEVDGYLLTVTGPLPDATLLELAAAAEEVK